MIDVEIVMEVRLWGHPPDPLRIVQERIGSIPQSGDLVLALVPPSGGSGYGKKNAPLK